MSECEKNCEGCTDCPTNTVDEVCADCPTNEAEAPKEPVQQAQQDPTAQFDVTRQARQEAIKQLEQVLDRASKGSKLDGKEMKKALRSLYVLTNTHDGLLLIFMRDMYRMAMHMAQDQMNLFAIRTHLKTIVKALEQKGVVTEKELEEIHDKEILPQEFPAMEKAVEEAEREISEEEEASTPDTEVRYEKPQSPSEDQSVVDAPSEHSPESQ
jgi:hypothetical protein